MNFPNQKSDGIRHISPEEMVVLDFNQFVHEAGINGDCEAFHAYVTNFERSTPGNTPTMRRGVWKIWWKRFCQESDLRDQKQTQVAALR